MNVKKNNTMYDINMKNCIACVKNRQCKNKIKMDDFCGTHLKSKNVKILDHFVPCYYKKNYSEFSHQIITIQKYIRGYLKMYVLKLRGPGSLNRKLINNETDFVSYEDIKSLPLEMIFTYIDEDLFIFGFDIKSVNILIERNQPNPYTTKKFTSKAIDDVKKLVNLLKYKQINLTIKNDMHMSEESIVKLNCVDIFQKMDELKLYTQIKWFIDLSLEKLKKLYIYIEDIWSYRAMITLENKKNFTLDGKAFTIPKSQIKNINNKLQIQKILLNEFNRFLSEGKTNQDKITSCYWVLTGLTMVSSDAAEAMPHLYQSTIEHSI